MRILYLVHQFYPKFASGTERFALNLASSLQRDGHFAEVVTYDLFNTEPFRSRDQLSAREYSYKNIPIVAVRHRTMPIDVHTSCEDPEIYRFAFAFLKNKGRYDVLHCAHAMRLTSFLEAARERRLFHVLNRTTDNIIGTGIIQASGDEKSAKQAEVGGLMFHPAARGFGLCSLLVKIMMVHAIKVAKQSSLTGQSFSPPRQASSVLT